MTDRKVALIVDDSEMVVDLFRALLEERDLSVHAVTDVPSAVAFYDSVHVDVVVTDHEMPQQTGLDLVDHIAGRTPIVVCTAYPDVAGRYRERGIPRSQVIVKPFRVLDMRDLVRHLAGLPPTPTI